MKKILLLILAILVVIVCVDQTYRSPLVDARVEAKTELACKYTLGVVPPKKFTSDGCSLFPEGFRGSSWEACCVAHDAVYWCGGEDSARARADDELAQCANDAMPHVGTLIKTGAHIGGVYWLPTPWRWGYGWRFGEWFGNASQ